MLQLLSRVQSVQAMIFQRQRSSLGTCLLTGRAEVKYASKANSCCSGHHAQKRNCRLPHFQEDATACSIVTCAGLFSILKFVHEKAMLASPPCLHPNVCVSRHQFPCELCATCTKIGPKIARAHGTVVGLRECPETLGSSHSRPDSPNHGIGDVP